MLKVSQDGGARGGGGQLAALDQAFHQEENFLQKDSTRSDIFGSIFHHQVLHEKVVLLFGDRLVAVAGLPHVKVELDVQLLQLSVFSTETKSLRRVRRSKGRF